MKKVNKHFVSDIDLKIKQFNDIQPKSASQIAEIEKYNKIFELRDEPNVTRDTQGSIWGEEE